MEFEPADWAELERSSFVDGINEILSHEEERLAAAAADELAELAEQEEKRRRQIAEAEAWERRVIEERRAEQLKLRILEERARVRLVVDEELSERSEENLRRLALGKTEQDLRLSVVAAEVARKKTSLKKSVYGFLAAAAVVAATLTVSFHNSQADHRADLASLQDEATDVARAAQNRVAELEMEIARSAHLADSQRELLEEQLTVARAAFAEAESESKELDSTKGTRSAPPKRLAVQKHPAQSNQGVASPPSASGTESSVKVAADAQPVSTCAAYDPMCFEL
jgi:hypothetical protein